MHASRAAFDSSEFVPITNGWNHCMLSEARLPERYGTEQATGGYEANWLRTVPHEDIADTAVTVAVSYGGIRPAYRPVGLHGSLFCDS